MNETLILLPLLFQLALAVLMLFFWFGIRAQRNISIVGNIVNTLIAALLMYRVWGEGILTVQAGAWPAPHGITFVADTFAALLTLLTAVSGLAVATFSAGSVTTERLRFGYFSTLQFLLLGLTGAFLAGDVFNLYVWFEIIIISSFVLITIGGEKAQIEGAIKYFALNMLASVIFLTAIAVLYGLTGSLNMADLAQKMPLIPNKGLVGVCALLFFVAFGIKSAVFPLYFWLPDSYHTPPAAVSAIFGGLLTKVGVYALVRMFSLIFREDAFWADTFAWVAALTLVAGGMGALSQRNLRKIFSYLIICHIGYMIGGLSMFTRVGFTGLVFYLTHDIVVKTNLFMAAGVIYKIRGRNLLKNLGGLYADYPRLSLLLAVPLFSLVGIPPLSGFWPKISLISAGVNTGRYWLTGCIIFASFITLYVIAKVWAEVFWKPQPEGRKRPEFEFFEDFKPYRKRLVLAPIVFLSLISLYIGLGAEHIQAISLRIAEELSNPETYIQAVFKTKTTQ
ncbi:MAG: proton-conducting transporter membrane subunit [Saprospiraceae bacterium]